MAEGDDEPDGGAPAQAGLETEPWRRPITIKRCDPPDGAVTLTNFLRLEAGAELAAIKAAFERLVKAYRSADRAGAADSFAGAVCDFHERARRRLLTGEVVGFARLPEPWCPYGRIPEVLWPYLVWGDIGEWDGFDWSKSWQPPQQDDWKIGYSEAFGTVKLADGWDPPTEVAFTWMANLRLDEVVRGSCTRPFKGNGWHILGLSFARPRRRLVNCVVADVASVSAEDACRVWLGAEVAAGPPRRTKTDYRRDALDRWRGLSRRAFDGLWAEVTREASGWGKAGRPKKNNHREIVTSIFSASRHAISE